MGAETWFVQTIYVASVTGSLDSYGKATYAAARAVKARVEQRSHRVITSLGEEKISTHIVYTAEPLKHDDRIWVPGLNPAVVEGSKRPMTLTESRDKAGARPLVRADL